MDTDIDIDHFARIGPKSGVILQLDDARNFLAHLGHVVDMQASASGYNNRLYRVELAPSPKDPCGSSVATSSASATVNVVVKAGGRYWTRVKTEAEVAGLTVAGAVPVPGVLAWRSLGPQELIAIDHQPGIVLKALWPHLHPAHRLSAVTQLAHIVCRMKTSPDARVLVDRGAIGNLHVQNGPVTHATGPPTLNDITLGPMVDGGLGPWFPLSSSNHAADLAPDPPVLVQYIQDTTQAAVAILQSPALDVLSGMRDRLAPRIHAYLATLEAIAGGTAAATTSSSLLPSKLALWDSVPLALIHGDLNLQNILVAIDGITHSLPMSTTDPFTLDKAAAAPILASLGSLDPSTHPLTITSILDWEWCGVFPWIDEFRASFDFLSPDEHILQDEADCLGNAFYSVLEASGLPTPRQHAQGEWAWLAAACAVRDAIAPWWMRDLVDPSAEEHRASTVECEKELDEALAKLGF